MNLTTILTSLAKHPAGHLRLTSTTLLSLAPNGLTLDAYALTAPQAAALTSILLLARDGGPDQQHHQQAATAPSSASILQVPPPSSTALPIPPDLLLGPCSPPLACRNSTTCGTGCGACTYLGFFPYGLCLAG